MSAVSDTSPLLRFASIGQLDLVRLLYGDVIIPPAVWFEAVVAGANRSGAADVAKASWIRQQSPTKTARLSWLVGELGQGEAEAIALASELPGTVPLILDDRKGRRVATELGLSVVGTAGVLLLAKNSGLIPLVRPPLIALRTAGFYLDDATFGDVLHLAGEEAEGDQGG